MTTWKKGKIIEQFEFFDDNYFNNCYDWMSHIPDSSGKNSFLDAFGEFIKYVSCPIVHFDNLLIDAIYQFIVYIYLSWCRSNGVKESFENEDYLQKYNATVSIQDPSNHQSINAIISNHLDWIIQNGNDALTTAIINVIILAYNTNIATYTPLAGEENVTFDAFFNNQLYDEGIQNDIKKAALSSMSTEDMDTINANILKNESKDMDPCEIKVKSKRHEYIKYAKLIRQQIYYILEIPILIFVAYNMYFLFFINEFKRPELYIPNFHKSYWLYPLSMISGSYNTMYQDIHKHGENHYDSYFKTYYTEQDTIRDDTQRFFDYWFDLMWRPYIYFIKFLRWSRGLYINAYDKYELKNYNYFIFFIIFMITFLLFNYVIYELSYFVNIFKSIIQGSGSAKKEPGLYESISNSIICAILFSVFLVIIIVLFIGYLYKKFKLEIINNLSDLTSGITGIILFILRIIWFFAVVIMRGLVSFSSISLCIMICIIQLFTIIFGGMKYLSVREKLDITIETMNKEIYKSIFKDDLKPTAESSKNRHMWEPYKAPEEGEDDKSPEDLDDDGLMYFYKVTKSIPKYLFIFMFEIPLLIILSYGINVYKTEIDDPTISLVMILVNTLAIFALFIYVGLKAFKGDSNGYSLLGSYKKFEWIYWISFVYKHWRVNNTDTKSLLEELYGKP